MFLRGFFIISVSGEKKRVVLVECSLCFLVSDRRGLNKKSELDSEGRLDSFINFKKK